MSELRKGGGHRNISIHRKKLTVTVKRIVVDSKHEPHPTGRVPV